MLEQSDNSLLLCAVSRAAQRPMPKVRQNICCATTVNHSQPPPTTVHGHLIPMHKVWYLV